MRGKIQLIMDNPAGSGDQYNVEMTGLPPAQAPPSYPPQQAVGYQPQPASNYPPPQPATGYLPSQPVYAGGQTTTNTNTTVVIQQPQPQLVVQGPQGWSTSLCDCFADWGLCLCGFFCPLCLPCVVSCKANECCCVGVMCPVALRASIRERHNIRGDILGDYCTLCWCPECAFCQMGRELNIRGA